MAVRFFLLLIFWLVGPSVGFADCLSSPEVDRILGQFNFVDPQGPVPMESRLCENNSIERKMVDSLLLLNQVSLNPGQPDQFDQNLMEFSPLKFFEDRIHTIRFETPSKSSACGGMTVAYVLSSERTGTMHICPYGNVFSTTIVASFLVHEARHVEGFTHVFCNHGYYLGSRSCDESYQQGGSYGIGLEFLVKASRAAALPDWRQQEARGTAIADFVGRFNKPPFDLSPGLAVLSRDGNLELFDGQNFSLLVPKIPDQFIVAERDLPAIFDPSAGTATTVIDKLFSTPTLGTLAQNFRNLDPLQRNQILDIFFGDVACWLTVHSLHCERGLEHVDLPLPEGLQAKRFFVLNSNLLEIAYIQMENGQLFQIPQDLGFDLWKPETLKLEDITAIQGLLGFGTISGNRRVGISLDGQLLMSKTSQPWSPVPGQEDRRFKKILRSIWWSDILRNL